MMTHSLSFFFLLLCPLSRSASFLIPSIGQAQHKKHRSITIILQSTASSSNDDVDNLPSSLTRRLLLSSSLFTPFILSSSAAQAAAEEQKVILSTSTSNFPTKYEGTSTSAISSPLEYFGIDPEQKRIAVFERAAPSVVYIDTFAEQRDAFSTNVMEVPLGAGSGFVWDEKGHIVTNYHVVRLAKTAQVAILTKVITEEDASMTRKSAAAGGMIPQRDAFLLPYTSMKPTTLDGSVTNYTRSVYKARVVGVDPGKDIAVLKVDAPVYDLHPISVGTSSGLKVGQTAMAIGNPFGLDHTLTVGVISGIGREVKSPSGRPISNVIQSDAAINPGNSGGPLLDGNGRLIGMNTAIFSPSGASAGIGFAIPVDSVKYIVDTLIRDGKIVRPVIGISYLESKQAMALGIRKGVLILDVPVGSPAYRAGLRGTRRTESGLIEIGDIIVKVDEIKIDTEADLFKALEDYKPGDSVKVTVERVEAVDGGGDGGRLTMRQVQIVTRLQAMSETIMVPR